MLTSMGNQQFKQLMSFFKKFVKSDSETNKTPPQPPSGQKPSGKVIPSNQTIEANPQPKKQLTQNQTGNKTNILESDKLPKKQQLNTIEGGGNSTRQNQLTEATSVAETEYSSLTGIHEDEAQKQEDLKRDSEEFFNNLFKSKEINFKNQAFEAKSDRLNADLLKDAFEIKFKDADGRIIFHRAAIEQNPETIRQTLLNLEHLNKQQLQNVVEQKDSYGNTALALAPIYNIDAKQHNRFEVVKQLLQKQANPNTQNPRSQFTPLHWAALNGASDVVTILLQFDAKEYIPDVYGMFPIDYAGYFRHYHTVEILIRKTLSRVDQMRRQNQNIAQWENSLRPYIDQAGRLGPQGQSPDNLILLFNPVLHTSILYWASIFNEIPNQLVEEILAKLEAYPEGPVAMGNWKTPCHAAAYLGSVEKMKLLLSDVFNRYQKETSIQKNLQFKKLQICPYYELRWNTLLKQNRYKQLRQFYNQVFQSKLDSYRKLPKFKFDFQDKFLNTPLHIASQCGNTQCAQMLINEYFLQLDIRNQQGWMPKDLKQHDSIKLVYYQFYKRLDEINNQGRQQNMSRNKTLRQAQDDQAIKQLMNVPSQIESTDMNQGNGPELSKRLVVLPEKDRISKELLKCREWLPQVPPLVLKVSVKDTVSPIINQMINVLISQEFNVQMIPSLNPEIYYIAIQLKQSKLETEAKLQKIKIKLTEIDAKQPFEPNQKAKFEPFRTKDIQTIMVGLLQNLINTQQLIQQGILIQILPMHDMFEIHEIRDKFVGQSRFFPQPLPLINQMYREEPDCDFVQLSAIKNYFGEKTAFYYSFISFYTVWMIIPAGLALALTIYQIAFDVDTIFTTLYAILICVWVTIFIERWKRKSSEIAFKWGTLIDKEDKQREIRPEFNGDEYFSNITFQVDKAHVNKWHYFFGLISIPIFLILIGSCVGVYFATKYYKDNYQTGDKTRDQIIQITAGVINGISIAIVNQIYQSLALISMKLENHKYQDSYESSFIYKLFAFKFINTNISLFYTAFIEQSFQNLYYLLLGMVIQKSIQILVLKNVYKLVLNWWAKRSYFKRVITLAKEQQLQHDNFISELDPETRQEFTSKIQEINKMPLFAKAKDPMSKSPTYQRLIFNTNKCIDEQQVLVDYIEVNSVMRIKTEQFEINEISEVFILFGLATLYACACPIVTIVVIVHNLIDLRLDLYINYACTRRILPKNASNIGPWLEIVQFMATVAVVSNCLLLYFSSPRLREWMVDHDTNYDDTSLLWTVLGVEHAIFLLKFFCQFMIDDMPTWVEKSLKRVKHEQEKLLIEENERDEKERILQLKAKIDEMEERNRMMLSSMKQKLSKMKSDMGKKDKQINDLGTKVVAKEEEAQQLKGIQVLKSIEQEEQARKRPDQVGLVDFIGISTNEWKAKDRIPLLEKSLNRNLRTRLISQTFSMLEKDILSKRISKLYLTKNINQINCAECSSQLATMECFDCQDHFCKSCSEEIHSSKKEFIAAHNVQPIPIETQVQQFSLLKTTPAIAYSVPKNVGGPSQWKKFENFNFPLDPGNDLYHLIQKHYIYLRSLYIDQNYIEPNEKINYQGLFVDRNYDLLTDIQAKVLMQKNKKAFDNPPSDISSRFNEEELFYMNRVAYYLFRHKGESLTFANFVNRLEILQSAPYQKRVTLWLSILDERGDEVITRTQFETIVRVSFIQDITSQVKDTQIVDQVYAGAEAQQMTINKIIEVTTKNEAVKRFMECLLQYNSKEVIEL